MRCGMTDTESLANSLLLAKLCNFLENPVIRLETTNSDSVHALQAEIARQKEEIERLRVECKRIEAKYGNEVIRNLRLEDLCREHMIDFRN